MPLGGFLANYALGQKFGAPIQEQQMQTALMQQQLQQAKQQQQQEAMAAAIMSQLTGQNGIPASPGMTQIPGGLPQGMPASAGMPGVPPSTSGGAGPNISQMNPSGDISPQAIIQAMSSLGQSHNIPGNIQFGAAKDVMALMSPYEKMATQMQMKQQQLQAQSDMLGERLKEMDRLGLAKIGSQQDISNQRIASQEKIAGMRQETSERGQDIQKGLSEQKLSQDASKMDSSMLNNELTRTTSRMNALVTQLMGKAKDSPEYQDLQKQWSALKDEIDSRRKDAGLPPRKMEMPTMPAEKASVSKNKPQASDVAYLKAHPEVRKDFDAHFGAGASAAILGQ